MSDDYPDVVDNLKDELQDYREAVRSTDTELPAVETSEAVKQRPRELDYKDS